MGRGETTLRNGDDVRDMVAGCRQEMVDVVCEAISEGTLEITPSLPSVSAPEGTGFYRTNGLDQLCVWLHAVAQNITATDTITFTFYRREVINGVVSFSEIYQAAKYTVVTTGVTAGQTKKFLVDDTDEIIQHATHYTVATSAGIAIPTGGAGKITVGKSLAV